MTAPEDPMDLRMGDVVRLRKPHPCGGTDWEVVRLGGDIGLRCLRCDRRIILERPVLRRRMKEFVSRGAPLAPEVEQALFGAADETPRAEDRAGERAAPPPRSSRGASEGGEDDEDARRVR